MKYLRRTEGPISGVCGGLGKYFDLDPVIFRIIFGILIIGYGVGLLPYILLWIAMPEED